MTSMLQDLRQGLHRLRKAPGFSVLIVGTFGLAVGAHAAVFGLLDVLFLRGLPVEDPDELVGVYESRDGEGFHPLSLPDARDHRRNTTVFEGLAVHYPWAPLILRVGNGPTEEINASVVSPDYFSVLGVEPAMGRFFGPGEAAPPGAHPVAVVSHDLWRSRLDGPEDPVGVVLTLNDTTFTVVGVAPEGFDGVVVGQPSEVWIPTSMASVGYRWCDPADRDCTWVEMIGRLAPGRTLEDARTEMEGLGRRVRRAHPTEGGTRRGLAVAPLTGLDPDIRRDRIRLVSVLLAAVTLLVVVGAANVGGLLIARGLVRRREVAVRTALGASRGRVISLFLAETVPLSLAGGVAGLLVAEGFSDLVGRLYPSAVPLELGIDLRVAAYALALAVVLGLAVGGLPGLHAARPSAVTALGGATAPGRRRRFGLLGSLVVVQIALSFVLVAGVGLLVRSVTTVSRAGSFDPERIATLRLRPRLVGYGPEQARPVTREIVDRLSALPGIRSVTLGAGLPPPFWYDGPYSVGRPGESAGTGEGPTAWTDAVGPRFFETFSLALLQGRDFDERDTPETPPVTIVNRGLAARLWPDGDAVGRRLVLDGETYRVIGVVEDPPAYGDEERTLLAYLAYWQDPGRVDARVAVATEGPAGPLLPPIRQVIHGVDPDVPVVETRTMRGKLRRGFAQVHLAGRVLGAAGGLTLLLSLVGLSGVVGLSVAQRTREIAVRRALGSTRPQAVGLILRDTSILVMVALAGGLGAALVLGRTLDHYLYGIGPRDPATLGVALVAVALSGTLASWWPARRAARIDPATVLRDSG